MLFIVYVGFITYSRMIIKYSFIYKRFLAYFQFKHSPMPEHDPIAAADEADQRELAIPDEIGGSDTNVNIRKRPSVRCNDDDIQFNFRRIHLNCIREDIHEYSRSAPPMERHI